MTTTSESPGIVSGHGPVKRLLRERRRKCNSDRCAKKLRLTDQTEKRERQRVCREICEINQRQAKKFSKKTAAARKREREGAISKSRLVSVRDELERERAQSDMYTSVCLF